MDSRSIFLPHRERLNRRDKSESSHGTVKCAGPCGRSGVDRFQEKTFGDDRDGRTKTDTGGRGE